MQNASFLKLKLRLSMMRSSICARRITLWMASGLILLISLIALFAAGDPLSAQEQKSPAKPIPTVKLHEPLGGRNVSTAING